jgi:uncharacterized RDD family membrane protein YckC
MDCPNHPGVSEGLVRCTRCGRRLCRDCVIQLRGFYYCGACKGEQIRDVQSGTAPGSLELASVGRRWLGVIVDQLALGGVAFVVVMLAAMGLAVTGRPGQQPSPVASALFLVVYLLTVFGLPIAYDGYMVQTRGQTFGKMALGVKVVNPDGSDVAPWQAWARAAVKLLLGSCLGITYLPALFTREKTTVHDMVAKTRVVRIQS